MESIRPTWWDPSRRWPRTLVRAPITSAVFERIPDDDSFVDYYLYLCSCPAGAPFYRASPRAVSLHRRAIRIGCLRIQSGNTPLALWQPLIDLDFAPVWEEFLVHLRDGLAPSPTVLRQFLADLFATGHRRISALVLNPRNVERTTAWMRDHLIPWHPANESAATATRRSAAFRVLVDTVILPALSAAGATVYASAKARVDLYRDELLSATWGSPSYCLDWCLTESEAADLRTRWSKIEPPVAVSSPH